MSTLYQILQETSIILRNDLGHLIQLRTRIGQDHIGMYWFSISNVKENRD